MTDEYIPPRSHTHVERPALEDQTLLFERGGRGYLAPVRFVLTFLLVLLAPLRLSRRVFAPNKLGYRVFFVCIFSPMVLPLFAMSLYGVIAFAAKSQNLMLSSAYSRHAAPATIQEILIFILKWLLPSYVAAAISMGLLGLIIAAFRGSVREGISSRAWSVSAYLTVQYLPAAVAMGLGNVLVVFNVLLPPHLSVAMPPWVYPILAALFFWVNINFGLVFWHEVRGNSAQSRLRSGLASLFGAFVVWPLLWLHVTLSMIFFDVEQIRTIIVQILLF